MYRNFRQINFERTVCSLAYCRRPHIVGTHEFSIRYTVESSVKDRKPVVSDDGAPINIFVYIYKKERERETFHSSFTKLGWAPISIDMFLESVKIIGILDYLINHSQHSFVNILLDYLMWSRLYSQIISIHVHVVSLTFEKSLIKLQCTRLREIERGGQRF